MAGVEVLEGHWMRVNLKCRSFLHCHWQVEQGCSAAIEETKLWVRKGEKQERERWITCGLIDLLHAKVAVQQACT